MVSQFFSYLRAKLIRPRKEYPLRSRIIAFTGYIRCNYLSNTIFFVSEKEGAISR